MTRLSEPVRTRMPMPPVGVGSPAVPAAVFQPSTSSSAPSSTLSTSSAAAPLPASDGTHSPASHVPYSVPADAPATLPPNVTPGVVAARLRWFRTERGLRLEDVAKRAGYTKGFLSKIEHGKASPPVATLLRVAAALGVEKDVLFAPDAGVAPDASVHTPSGDGVPVRDDTSGPGRALLALAANRHHKLMEPFVVEVGAGETVESAKITHPGEEFVYVLQGEVEFAVGDELFSLKPGDGLYFNATRPHVASARGGTAKFVRVFCASPARRQRVAGTDETSHG